MASTIEMFLAGLALIINTVAIFVLYFVNNAFLGPFVKAIDNINVAIGGPLSIGEFTYFAPYVFALLLIFEVILFVAFIIVCGRRTYYEEDA